MGWEVYARPYYSESDITTPTIYQPVQFQENAVVRAVRIWVVVYGDPAFTSLGMSIYSNNENTVSPTPVRSLLQSTNTFSKADVHTLDYAVKELYFEFSFANLRRSTWYHFVLTATGYSSPSTSSHIGWRVGYPDPNYAPEGLTLSPTKVGNYPLSFYPIFARFNRQ